MVGTHLRFNRIGRPKKKTFDLDMCLTLGSLVSRLCTKCPFLTLNGNILLSFSKLLSWMEVENGHFYPPKRGPTLKLSFPRSCTCQSQMDILSPWPTAL